MKAMFINLRYRMKYVLRALERGEIVTVLYRGTEKAKLVPVAGASPAPASDPAKTTNQPFFGMWGGRDELDPASYLRNLRKSRPVTARPL